MDQADACCQYMNQRIWHGKVIQCQTWDGSFLLDFFEKINSLFFCFKGSTKYDFQASTDAEKERIDEWHRFLTEGDEDEL